MFTLPCHKHNPIKITLKNGEVILAKITRFNDETGKVNWKDKADPPMWSGTTHCTRVIKATPEEVLVWAKAHAVTLAPTDPCMARWSLGKTKRGPMMMEGYYFAVPVLLNGKKVGEIIDEGNGGSVMTRFKDHLLATAFEKDCTEWCRKNGASMDYLEAESEFWAWWDEGRAKGKDAATFIKEQREETEKMFPGPRPEIKQTPIHTGNLALVKGNI